MAETDKKNQHGCDKKSLSEFQIPFSANSLIVRFQKADSICRIDLNQCVIHVSDLVREV